MTSKHMNKPRVNNHLRWASLAVLVLAIVFMSSCGGGKEFKKSPLDVIIRDLPTDQTFSIILHDMDVEGSFFKTYKHQYKVITIEKSQPGDSAKTEEANSNEEITGFYEVGKEEFERNEGNMGMVVAHRGENGEVEKKVSPPGYAYVGNPNYGHWVNRGGNSFWEFYGKFAFMNSMFNLMSYPIRRPYYNDYYSNYYPSGRVYYGPNTGGYSYYGTNSKYNSSRNPNSSWSRNPRSSSFKQSVRDRTSRSSSRYGSGSSRSRGSGYGK